MRARPRHGAVEPGEAGPDGLPLGAEAPGFNLPALGGISRSLDALRGPGRPVLLLFSDSACGPCMAMAPDVARWQRDHARDLTIAVVERDRDGRGPLGPDGHGRTIVLFQRESELADLYRVQGTPTAVLVARDGTIASAVAAGAGQIEELVSRHVHGLRPRAPRRGRPRAPFRVRRRELLVRGAGAWAAASAVLAWPVRAVAVAAGRTPRAANPRCSDRFDCPHRDGFAQCVNGRCRCGGTRTYCSHEEADDRHCFDLQTSKDHCGSCNHACTGADHDVCCEGKCGEFGQTRCFCGDQGPCEGEDDVCGGDAEFGYICFPCADFGWKRCGNECGDPHTQRCCGGRLYRKDTYPAADWTCCGPETNRRLINTGADVHNCGACGKRCREGELCSGGRCVSKCPPGRRRCGDACGDPATYRCCKGKLVPRSDPKNCGGCGIKCHGPFDTGECCNGKCCDINGNTCCPDGCKNLALDDDNCGGCGNKCGPNSYCRFGICTCPAEPCP